MSQRDMPAFNEPRERRLESVGAGTFGVLLFLLALSVLFGATIAGYLYLRSLQPVWPPPGSPPLPMAGLWLSTLLIVLVSAAIEWARRSVRWDRQRQLCGGLASALVLGSAFLVNQAHNWWVVAEVFVPPQSRAKVFLAVFYILTGTHALHVIGGLILLAIVIHKAWRGAYSSVYYPGVRYSAMYWHFLDVVWVIMFTLLFLI